MTDAYPLQILHVTRTLAANAGGPPRSTARLAAAHAMLGHKVSLISGGPSPDDPEVQDVLTAIPGIERVSLLDSIEDSWSWRGKRNRDNWRSTVQGFDVVAMHGFWRPIFSDAAKACRNQKVPYILTPRGALDAWSLRQKRLKKRAAMALSFRRILNQCLFVHALTDHEAASIADLSTQALCEVIPNGVYMAEYESPPSANTFFSAHPQLQGRPFALFMSRLHHKKGLIELVDSIGLLKERGQQTDLVIAGPDDGMRSVLHARIASMGIEDSVHFTGALYGQEKAAALQDASCFCLPSKQEGFSMAILEAMAAGLPVVITDACHFPAAIEAGAGIECTTDPESIAAALTTLLSSPEMARQFGDSGRQLVSERFSWPTIAERSIEIIRSHLNRVAICL